MFLKSFSGRYLSLGAITATSLSTIVSASEIPVVTQSNVTMRVMASNLSSGNNQRYETPGLNILKGLKPDIVAMQEFNVTNSFGVNTPAAISNMVATTFGTNFVYFRETGYSIPNGIISRWPFVTNGTWVDSDTGVNDRGFAWAKIKLPGTNELVVVSVHLKASSGSDNPARRAAQAAEITSLIQATFGTNGWIIVAGDMNLYSDSEAAITTFKTYLSDSPVPADQNGNVDTNAGRTERYDRVLPSFAMTNLLVPVVMPSRSYLNGLVFDSRIYTNLTDVPPVVSGDSGASGMQHMGVVKAFTYSFTATNFITVDSPVLTYELPGILRWQGVSTLTYSVLASTNLTDWNSLGTATSTTTFFSFTNIVDDSSMRFYRVTYP